MATLPTFGALLITSCVLGCLAAPQGQPLVVMSIPVEPFLRAIETRVNSTLVVSYEGYIPDLLDELFKLAELPPYTLKVQSDYKFGYNFNGTWDGLIGDVQEGRADIAAGPLTETASRSTVVDFSTPFMNFGPVVVLKRPQTSLMTLQDRLQRLFSPLSQSIWMMSGLAWLITSVTLYIICHFNPYEWRRLAKDKQASLREGESFSCLNTFWFTMSNILWQGYTSAPRSMGARVVVAFWWMYVLIFVVMYIASMSNYLRVGPTQDTSYTNIQSIADLGKQTKVKFGVVKDGTTELYLLSAKDPEIKNVWNTISKNKMYVTSPTTAFERLRKSKKPYAFITESAIAKFFVRQTPCNLYMVADFTTIGAYSLAFRLNSSLVKPIDIAMLTLRENGVLRELEDRWFSGGCTGTLVGSNRNKMEIPPYYGVDIGTFSGAIIILLLGLVIGGLTTVIEVVVFKYAEKGGDKERDGDYKALATSDQEKNAMPISSLEPEPITDV